MKQIYIFKPKEETKEIFNRYHEVNLQLKIVITRYVLPHTNTTIIQKHSKKKLLQIIDSLKENEYFELVGGKE